MCKKEWKFYCVYYTWDVEYVGFKLKSSTLIGLHSYIQETLELEFYLVSYSLCFSSSDDRFNYSGNKGFL